MRARAGWPIRVALLGGAAAVVLTLATLAGLRDFPQGLDVTGNGLRKPMVLARDGTPLSMSLQNDWNSTDMVSLDHVPPFLQQAFISSEDRHFHQHHGVDWHARFAALWQDLKARAAIRGASTITEQVVRMLHPRPRTLWSRWLEGFEAQRLERRCSKAQILEFYINQMPYAARRRGVRQAAMYYYNRDLDTLTPRELLSLVVLVRSPMGMDLGRNPRRASQAIDGLAERMAADGSLTATDLESIRKAELALAPQHDLPSASYFVHHALDLAGQRGPDEGALLRTTLDAHLQDALQQILDASLSTLVPRRVHDAAVLVVDHSTNEVLAWVVASKAAGSTDSPGLGFDAVLTPRQPGSTMKPLLYAMALERGWTAATLIDDSELSEAVGSGEHSFHNYSRTHYGLIRLREALGNSLNIPAVKTLKFVGDDAFLGQLHQLGITSLQQNPAFYGDGLALGNGEIPLYQMTQAYTALARQGRYRPLSIFQNAAAEAQDAQAYSADAASLIANILSDPEARQREFGRGLQFPVETAIKTGTSTDYRDAWAIAFDYAHTVGVWVGNLDNTPMDGITGAEGPAMILRSVFTELNRNQDTRGLAMSKSLVPARICGKDGRLADGHCESLGEWFTPGTVPQAIAPEEPSLAYRLAQPTPGLLVARDPRIPDELQALPMTLNSSSGLNWVDWNIDGSFVSRTKAGKYLWHLQSGTHEVYARISEQGSNASYDTAAVRFYVR